MTCWFGAVGGPLVTGPSLEQVVDLDANIEHLNSDIFSAPDPEGHALDPKPMAWRKYKVDWTAFHVHWQAWKADHPDPLTRSTDESANSFGKFTTDYNEFRRRLTEEFGVATTAAEGQHEKTLPSAALGAIPWTAVIVLGGAALLGYALITTGAGGRARDYVRARMPTRYA